MINHKETVSEAEFPFLAIQSNPIYVLHFFEIRLWS